MSIESAGEKNAGHARQWSSWSRVAAGLYIWSV